MPGVYFGAKILNEVSSDSYQQLSEVKQFKKVEKFFNLKDEKKPNSFRNKTKEELKEFFLAINPQLKQIIGKEYGKQVVKLVEDSPNNKIGSDLIAYFPKGNQRIELKFGSETNSNIGNDTMDKLFGLTGHGQSFSKLCSKLRKDQFDFVVTQQNFECEESNDHLKELVTKMADQLNKMYEQGIIRENSKEIKHMLEASGSIKNYDLVGDKQIKIFVSFRKSLARSFKVAKKLDLTGEWRITSIKKAIRSNRVEIWISNGNSKAKLLLNWKNNYKDKKNNLKYSAKLGVGYSNWNVWLYKC